MFNFFNKRKYKDYDFNPDEIFIDTLNVSNMNKQQFEGVMEKKISPKVLAYTAGFFSLFVFIFLIKLFSLQIINGESFFEKSENNSLREKPIFAERGLIYDRNNVELAWNASGEESDFLHRQYIADPGFGHLLGYVNYPQKDSNGNYWRLETEGQAAFEKKYNEILSGENGSEIFEVDALGKTLSSNNLKLSENGNNIHLSIDAKVQTALYKAIKKQADDFDFNAGAGGIMDTQTGEMIALVSYPEYDPYTLAEAEDQEKINSFFNDPKKPFLNRFVDGLYSPGSIVKPFLIFAALDDGLITKNTKMQSTGRIEIPNRYNPSNVSVYRDWRREGHGSTDAEFAIADSVNTFFYAISGGYGNQKGLGIKKMEEYLRRFGLAQKTGIDFGRELTGTIPNPEWKSKNYKDGVWRLGDTYITSIGQFGFQVSPVQMLRSTAALVNGGKLLVPKLIKDEASEFTQIENLNLDHLRTVQSGMRKTVTIGTAQNINVPEMSFAVKTATAQVGVNNEYYNSWLVGFFPYEEPRYALSLVMERGNTGDFGSAARAMRIFIDDVNETYPEFWTQE